MIDSQTRRVRRVRLAARGEGLVRRGAILLEDALRTASLPETSAGRVLIVRSLSIGTIRSQQSSATLALTIEQRLAQVSAMAVYAENPAARDAPAVYFHDEVAPYVSLAVRIARQESTDAWFWPLAVPVWQPEMPRDEALRVLLTSLLSTQAGVRAAAVMIHALYEQQKVQRLLTVLRWHDGPMLLKTCGWSKPNLPFVFVEPLPSTTISPLWHNVLARGIDLWGADDDRSVWLAIVALVAEQASRLLDPHLVQQAQRLIKLIVSQQVVGARHAVPRQKQKEGTVPQGEPVNQSEQELPWPDTPQPTQYGGVFFLLPVLARLGVVDWLAAHPQLIEQEFVSRLFFLIGQRLGIPADDPLWAAVPDVTGKEEPLQYEFLLEGVRPPDLAVALRAWRVALHRWCRRYVQMGLHTLICRPARIAVTQTHVDVLFDHRQADVRIRKGGLDLDPGWVPWFGRVVRFHYLYGEQDYGT